MSQTIWVVMGSTGEYSDRSEWLVVAFPDEAQAKRHADAATERALAFKNTKCEHGERMMNECDECGRPFTYDSAPTRAWMGELDPIAMRMDYTGSDYVALPVRFVSPPAGPGELAPMIMCPGCSCPFPVGGAHECPGYLFAPTSSPAELCPNCGSELGVPGPPGFVGRISAKTYCSRCHWMRGVP